MENNFKVLKEKIIETSKIKLTKKEAKFIAESLIRLCILQDDNFYFMIDELAENIMANKKIDPKEYLI